MNAAALEALGVYDPASPQASETLELLSYALELGATTDDLLEFRDQLAGLPSVLAMRDGPALTLRDAAERSGVAEDKLLRIATAAGLPTPGEDDRVFSEGFSDLGAGIESAELLFGEEAVLQLIRVMGSGMARIADAIMSAFFVNVEPDSSERLEVARANAQAGALIPGLAFALDVLLRQHLQLARRSSLGAATEGGYEKRRMCVGFVDLVGSTRLALGATASALGEVLAEFERASSEVVSARGGRVVKLIGDEVLFTAANERSASEIALALRERLAAHPSIPPVRAGLAGGDVLLRDGDVFGPVVNLAARVVGAAGAGQVLVPAAFAAAAGISARPLRPRELKGFEGAVELCELVPTGSGR